MQAEGVLSLGGSDRPGKDRMQRSITQKHNTMGISL
jgi:hypothetical protein